MEFVLFWVVLSLAVGILAHNKGRLGFGWFMLSLVFSPLLAGIVVLVLSNVRTAKADAAAAAEAPNPNTHVRCPDCRELVRNDARKCRYCSAQLVPQACDSTAI